MGRTLPSHAVFTTRPAQFEGPPPPDAEACKDYTGQILSVLSEDGPATTDALIEKLVMAGLDREDVRVSEGLAALQEIKGELSEDRLVSALEPETLWLMARSVSGQLVANDFPAFTRRLTNLFHYAGENRDGAVADYIPELSKADPEAFALGVCTIDGQRLTTGLKPQHIEARFCAQSAMKPVNYAIAQELIGTRLVHDFVGREPSGQSFNEITLDKNRRPHNPMINAGAIMTAGLIRPGLPLNERFDFIQRIWKSGCGGRAPELNQAVYQSEKAHADRNFALAYFMREHGCFPPETDMEDALDLYFRCCSLEMDIAGLSLMAGTLANGGVCPTTERRVFQRETVKNVLSLMLSCGMYDYSGEFAFTVGLPAKSGVSGAMMLVVPGIAGFAIYSPRLSLEGNPVRGVEFARQLVQSFPWHVYAPVIAEPGSSASGLEMDLNTTYLSNG